MSETPDDHVGPDVGQQQAVLPDVGAQVVVGVDRHAAVEGVEELCGRDRVEVVARVGDVGELSEQCVEAWRGGEVDLEALGIESRREGGGPSDCVRTVSNATSTTTAHHYLLAHVPTGAWAGCVRVVPGPDLPYEVVFGDIPVDLTTVPHAEISRLAVARNFRRGRDHRPPAMLHAALVAVAALVESGLDDAVCVMEPRLAAQLNAFGLGLPRISGPVRHRGERALFHLDPVLACREVRSDLRGVLTAIRSRIHEAARRQLRPAPG